MVLAWKGAKDVYEPHPSCISVHHVKVCADDFCKICFINYEEVGLSYSGTSLAGNLVTSGDINLSEAPLLVTSTAIYKFCYEEARMEWEEKEYC